MGVISGKKIALELKEKLKEQVSYFKNKYDRLPKLSVILVGDNPASISYVSGKEKACVEIGIINETIRLDENISEEELLGEIDKLNNDSSVDGILVQLPLPHHINEHNVIERIRSDKDVDGFSEYNTAKLYMKEKCIVPCTPKGIIKMLKHENVQIAGRHAVVIGRSQIVGQPVAKLLLDNNASVTILHSKSVNMKEISKMADILVVAVGRPKMITKEFVKEGATVIDVGVNRVDGHLCGDCDFEAIKEIANISKVPGGVGPMTIACLMENTIECFLAHMKE
jgi:methylenetetrahydrofolate dehydrogenase (NADP+)/methenyltetrahydrofolate cyclohydrolase